SSAGSRSSSAARATARRSRRSSSRSPSTGRGGSTWGRASCVRVRRVTESWRHRKTLILSRSDMVGLLTPGEYVDCVEHAFRMHGLGRVYMEPKGHIVLDRYQGEWEVMPSWIEEPEAAACKWVSIREDNSKYELPA